MDNARLVKLLNLTTSDNDHEALSAMRMANKIVREAGKRWNDLIGVVVKEKVTRVEWEMKREPPPPKKDFGIAEMFDVVRPRVDGTDAADFIDSLWKQWKRSKRLTVKQAIALKKFYDRCV